MARITDMEGERKRRGESPEEFYAAPREPPSESALPVFDETHTRDAMARFDQVDFRSKEEKARAYHKIIEAARKFGIEVEDFKKYSPE